MLSGVLRRLSRFSIASFLWLCLVAALLTLWYLDHQRLTALTEIRNRGTSTSWSIRQIVGPKDTLGFGDIATAWASKQQDAGEEWVVVEFAHTTLASAVEIYETYNPGAVVQISSVSFDGSEETVWQGTDPLINTIGGVAPIVLSKQLRTRRLKIVLDSGRHAGWNELDAVALVDKSGKRQWVTQAWASSSFGENRELPDWFWP